MNRYSEIKGLYKFNTMAGSFVTAVRNDSGEVMLLDGADPEFKAGEAVFVSMARNTTINYDFIEISIGKIIKNIVNKIEIPQTTDILNQIQTGKLKVLSTVEEKPINPDMTFHVKANESYNAPNVTLISDQNGKTLLLGYELPGTSFSFKQNEVLGYSFPVTPKSTALAICMMNTLNLYTNNSKKAEVAEKVVKHPKFNNLVALIENKIKNNTMDLS
ncbi:MAG TPA: hypothetical protein PK467_20975, partial [Candidatus Wallbacteria bacterium]|nr:hypothetical protein [Candidatus Wallbacteria bacterium]